MEGSLTLKVIMRLYAYSIVIHNNVHMMNVKFPLLTVIIWTPIFTNIDE